MTDIELALNEFVEMFDDYLDPEGNTSAGVVVDHYFALRRAMAAAAVQNLRAHLDEHPELAVTTPPPTPSPTSSPTPGSRSTPPRTSCRGTNGRRRSTST